VNKNEFKNILYPKTKEEAVIAIKNICIFLYFILVVKTYGIMTRGFKPAEIIEYIIILALVFTVQRFKSRVGAILLMLEMAPGQFFLMLARIVQDRFMALPVFIELTLIVTSISLVRTTFLFHKSNSNTTEMKA